MCGHPEGCKNAPRWLVNGRYREAQRSSCGIHLSATIADLATFQDDRYKSRIGSDGVRVFPYPTR